LKVMLHCCGGFRELIPSMFETIKSYGKQ
jgi:hypothetical protein